MGVLHVHTLMVIRSSVLFGVTLARQACGLAFMAVNLDAMCDGDVSVAAGHQQERGWLHSQR